MVDENQNAERELSCRWLVIYEVAFVDGLAGDSRIIHERQKAVGLEHDEERDSSTSSGVVGC